MNAAAYIERHTEAIFVACTQLRALEVVDMLERDLGKPVVSGAAAMMWHALRVAGERAPIAGFVGYWFLQNRKHAFA